MKESKLKRRGGEEIRWEIRGPRIRARMKPRCFQKNGRWTNRDNEIAMRRRADFPRGFWGVTSIPVRARAKIKRADRGANGATDSKGRRKRGIPHRAVETRAEERNRRAVYRQRQKGDSKRTLGGRGRGRERIPEALSFNQIHYTEFIAARELIKCRRINSRRSL